MGAAIRDIDNSIRFEIGIRYQVLPGDEQSTTHFACACGNKINELCSGVCSNITHSRSLIDAFAIFARSSHIISERNLGPTVEEGFNNRFNK